MNSRPAQSNDPLSDPSLFSSRSSLIRSPIHTIFEALGSQRKELHNYNNVESGFIIIHKFSVFSSSSLTSFYINRHGASFRQYLPVSINFILTSAKNSTDWSTSVQSTLLGHSLWGPVIDASTEIKSTTVIAKATWIDHDRRIISFIIASVDRTLPADLLRIPTAASLWNHLISQICSV